jgi:hypothetical protein
MKKTRKSLEAEGWMFQFLADETLAKDALEIYDLLGYEVHLQPPQRTRSKKCSSSSPRQFQGQCQIVYIRPRGSLDEEEKEVKKIL